MKVPIRLWCIVLFIAVFVAGCGCGDNGGPSVKLVTITVSPATASVPLGLGQQFTAMGTYSDNTSKDITDSVTWSSSDESIAGVSNEEGSKGSASSHAIGSTFITATQGDVMGSATLAVTAPVLVSIQVAPAQATVLVAVNQQYGATGTYTDNSTKDITTSVSWSSSQIAVASISNAAGSKGLATSLTPGLTTITATMGGQSGSATLTVTGPALVSIAVTPVNQFVKFDTTVQYAATGKFDDGTTRDITTVVTWSSSDETVATISNAPGSKGLAVTDHVLGSTFITATLGNISGSTKLIDP